MTTNRGTSNFVVPHIEVAIGVYRKAAGSHAAAELVEHTGVVHPGGLLEEAQHSVGHHLCHISIEQQGT